MNLYIYSDESGVFDKQNNDIYVFAGVILLGTQNKEIWSRKYSKAEKVIRTNLKAGKDVELKATTIPNKQKSNLFRSLNACYKFAVIIEQKQILDRIFESKKDKQRYLDYAYKIAVKKALENMMKDKLFDIKDVERIYFYVDEHTTATNGKYELREGLEQELKNGTYNREYSKFFPPTFPDILSIHLEFCNSKSKLLIRAADIVANRIYYLSSSNQAEKIKQIQNLYIINLPNNR